MEMMEPAQSPEIPSDDVDGSQLLRSGSRLSVYSKVPEIPANDPEMPLTREHTKTGIEEMAQKPVVSSPSVQPEENKIEQEPSSNMNVVQDSKVNLGDSKTSMPAYKFKLKDANLDDIIAELEAIVPRLYADESLTSLDVNADLMYIKESTTYDRSRSVQRITITDKLCDLGAIQIFMKVWQQNFAGGFTGHKDNPSNKVRYELMKNSMITLWNGTDSSTKMCQKILDTKAHVLIFEYLRDDQLSPTEPKNVHRTYLTKGLLGILHNVVRQTTDGASCFHENQAVDVFQEFRSAPDPMVRCKAEILLAYVVSEEEYSKINAGNDSIKFIIDLLEKSMETPEHYTKKYGFAADEILQGLNRLAVNDENKRKITDYGAVKYYVQLLQPDCSTNEKYQAAKGIWTLAFRCKDVICAEPGCVEGNK